MDTINDNKECSDCGFSTINIVTEDISNWSYCPICGSELYTTEEKLDDADEDTESNMKEIPINSDEQDETDESFTDDNSNTISEESIDQELERLKSRFKDDEENN